MSDARPDNRMTDGPADRVIGEIDPGYVGPRRLSNREYANTARDLLGVKSTPWSEFAPDPIYMSFDNMFETSSLQPEHRTRYAIAAQALADEVFADASLRSRVMTCVPDASPDAARTCAETIFRAFGSRAWRRPLTDAEVTDLLAVAALGRPGEEFDGAMRRVVASILSSDSFLFRIEVDSDPASTKPHPVTAYELASRLSYLLWSTMPDDRLFAAAADGGLVRTEVLLAEVHRMLADPRAERFALDFGWLWLGGRMLAQHSANEVVFPAWDELLRASMLDEMRRYFAEFIDDRGFDEFLTADINFVDARLARHYGFAVSPPSGATMRVEVGNDKRRGFFGLAGVLTATSHEARTSPTQRGAFVLREMLCIELPGPPINVGAFPDLPESGPVRGTFEAISHDPVCAECHVLMDGLGLGMQDFDGVGSYRTLDERGHPIDATGKTPDETRFNGAAELGVALAKDPRVMGCASRKAIMYAIGRALDDADQPYVDQTLDRWSSNRRFSNLLEQIVLSDPFRMRRARSPMP